MMKKYEFEALSGKIIGAAIRVHKELGPGFLEKLYEEALKIELSENGLHYDCQKEITVKYLGKEIGAHRLDLLVENMIIVELKTVEFLSNIHFAQILSYLKAGNLKIGILLNFAKPKLEIKRVVN